MLVIGLTGGIGMGKSAAAQHFASRGIPVFSADDCVHRLYEGEAVAAIEAAFPGATRDGRVDRKLLAAQVTGHSERLRKLAERRARADFVINGGTSLKEMHADLDQLIESLQNRKGRVMERLRHSYTD